MVTYAIETLVSAGVTELMVVTGGTHAGEFLRLLGNGHEYGIDRLLYAYQERPGGIAEALGLTERFVDGDRVVVMLADNVVERSLRPAVTNFLAQPSGSRIVLARIDDPAHLRHLGVPELDDDGRVVRILEKPDDPPSSYVVTGIYFYDEHVFDVIPTLQPSGRGELEITDVNNWYVERRAMEYDVLDGFWGDAGESIDAYYEVNDFVRCHGANKAERQYLAVRSGAENLALIAPNPRPQPPRERADVASADHPDLGIAHRQVADRFRTILVAVLGATVLGIACLAFYTSFEAIREYAVRSNGIAPEHGWAVPLMVDSFIVVALGADLWFTTTKARRAWWEVWWPKLLLAGAAGVSFVLNVAHAEPTVAARGVALIPPVALVLGVELLMMVLRRATTLRATRLQVEAEAAQEAAMSAPLARIQIEAMRRPRRTEGGLGTAAAPAPGPAPGRAEGRSAARPSAAAAGRDPRRVPSDTFRQPWPPAKGDDDTRPRAARPPTWSPRPSSTSGPTPTPCPRPSWSRPWPSAA